MPCEAQVVAFVEPDRPLATTQRTHIHPGQMVVVISRHILSSPDPRQRQSATIQVVAGLARLLLLTGDFVARRIFCCGVEWPGQGLMQFFGNDVHVDWMRINPVRFAHQGEPLHARP